MKQPIQLNGIQKQIIWGGTRLAREYGKGTPGEKIAESWELTCRPDGVNTIIGGKYDGLSFEDYLKNHPGAIGSDYKDARFPLLIKLIDAEADLSIQVHPDDAYAAAHTTDFGKTEMWYIVDAAPDAKIIYGLKEKYTSEQIRTAIADGKLEDLMNYVPVHKGETYFIPSGMVHAICHGILIAEIQQNSNITYRVYDYNRRQPDGSLRALHVDDALAVIDRFDPDACRSTAKDPMIASCKYFHVFRLDLNGKTAFNTPKSTFSHILCTEGDAVLCCGLHRYPIHKGDSFFIPAGTGKCTLKGKGTVLVTTL